MPISQTDISFATDYIDHRKMTSGGINIPESIEEFAKRTGMQIPIEAEYAIDYVFVQRFPHEKDYLLKKWGKSD